MPIRQRPVLNEPEISLQRKEPGEPGRHGARKANIGQFAPAENAAGCKWQLQAERDVPPGSVGSSRRKKSAVAERPRRARAERDAVRGSDIRPGRNPCRAGNRAPSNPGESRTNPRRPRPQGHSAGLPEAKGRATEERLCAECRPSNGPIVSLGSAACQSAWFPAARSLHPTRPACGVNSLNDTRGFRIPEGRLPRIGSWRARCRSVRATRR